MPTVRPSSALMNGGALWSKPTMTGAACASSVPGKRAIADRAHSVAVSFIDAIRPIISITSVCATPPIRREPGKNA